MLCQCPKCETIFRLSREHLDSANGQVSCSVCQFEFDAYESLVPEAIDKSPPEEAKDQYIDDHVPIIIIDDDEDDGDMSVLFSASLEEQNNDTEQAQSELALPEIEPDLTPDQKPETATETETTAAAKAEDPIPDYMESATPQGLSEQLESELMEAGLRTAAISTHRARRLLWNSAAILLILTLGLQYVYVIRNELAKSDSYRPWIEKYCQILGCNISLRSELQSIELLQREIAPDPDNENVLRVRAMFVNQASFKQAWPVVQITLSDTNNQIIAMRQLKPEEYLVNQSAKQGMIPGRQMTLDLRFFKPDKPVSTYAFDFL